MEDDAAAVALGAQEAGEAVAAADAQLPERCAIAPIATRPHLQRDLARLAVFA